MTRHFPEPPGQIRENAVTAIILSHPANQVITEPLQNGQPAACFPYERRSFCKSSVINPIPVEKMKNR